jgi:hypothetical protein
MAKPHIIFSKAAHSVRNWPLPYSRVMPDKLLISLFGLTISADGICAIVAAVIIIVLVVARPR